jgi:hypothetical protein
VQTAEEDTKCDADATIYCYSTLARKEYDLINEYTAGLFTLQARAGENG